MALGTGDVKSYRWESGYEKSWEELQDGGDGKGFAAFAESLALIDRKRKRQKSDKIVRLGMMRHLNIIFDCSDSMTDQDLKPTRHICALKLLDTFVKEFLEQNPISQLGIIITRGKKAERISDLSSNSSKHLKVLNMCSDPNYCFGEPSLQNSLELALSSMKMLPSHTSREILIVSGSLTTCDPGNIFDTIELLKSNGVKVSVIGLCAEVHVLRKLCDSTGGKYQVALDDVHFQEIILNYVKPLVVPKDTEATCVKMGFPRQSDKVHSASPCFCHLEEGEMKKTGYLCPQCNSKYCELPVDCKICGITLVTSAHLVRPLQHLIPIRMFNEITKEVADNALCCGCNKNLKNSGEGQITECNDCKQLFCLDCDIYIHNSLHMCPGCAVIKR